MKKFLFLFILVGILFGFESKFTPNIFQFKNVKCSQVLHNLKYDICYDYSRKDPLMTAYDITKQQLEGKVYKRPNYFKPDYRIPRKFRSYSKDLSRTGYDRGHNCPNAAFNHNKKLQKQTFIMSNVAPQAKWFNRILWAKIERFARYEAVKYEFVEVITGNCGVKGYVKNGVAIPKYFFKVIYIPKEHEYISFIAPNTNKGMKTAKIWKFLTTIQEIKNICHF